MTAAKTSGIAWKTGAIAAKMFGTGSRIAATLAATAGYVTGWKTSAIVVKMCVTGWKIDAIGARTFATGVRIGGIAVIW